MNRSVLLAVLALALGTEPGLAQPPGNVINPAPARNVMQRMGMMGGGMGGMGGGMGGVQGNPRRTVQVQMQGGKKIAGKMQLGQVFVIGDIGQYMIKPEFVKIIRFASKAKGEEDADENIQPKDEAVITTSGEEIRGGVQRANWVLEIDCGTLTLNPETLRSMTFLPPSEPKDTMSGQSSGATPALLSVTTIEAPKAVGLMVTGAKITRLAAATEIAGDWIPIDLREPVEGRAVPIVAQGIVVYGLGRHVYAFGSEARRWDILDLPEGASANPIVSPESARVQIDGIIHEFSASTGKWKHIDTRTILDTAQVKALKALQKPDTQR
jgi:hypothetical protein